jgi:flagellar FliJ protein
MARFRFRLQSVLDVRSRVVDERQRELALKQRELDAAHEKLASLDAARERQRSVLERDHRTFDVEALRATYGHLAYLDRAIEDQSVCVAACAAEVERAQHKLVVANTDRKVLETLRNRRYDAFISDAAQHEQREVDDLNARRFGRARNERGDNV